MDYSLIADGLIFLCLFFGIIAVISQLSESDTIKSFFGTVGLVASVMMGCSGFFFLGYQGALDDIRTKLVAQGCYEVVEVEGELQSQLKFPCTVEKPVMALQSKKIK